MAEKWRQKKKIFIELPGSILLMYWKWRGVYCWTWNYEVYHTRVLLQLVKESASRKHDFNIQEAPEISNEQHELWQEIWGRRHNTWQDQTFYKWQGSLPWWFCNVLLAILLWDFEGALCIIYILTKCIKTSLNCPHSKEDWSN